MKPHRQLLMLLGPIGCLVMGLCFASACQPIEAQPAPSEITGEVRFVGSAIPPRTLDRSLEPGCENGTAYVENVLVWDGKLANVHVSVASGTMGKHKPPKQPVIVQQADCIYVPRVQGLMKGQRVLITNGDPTVHNVHAKSGTDSLTNKSQPASSPAIEVDTKDAGDVLKLGCDVHRWMRAYMPITDHPYFDVTGPDGGFRIVGVPKGKELTIRAWHEKFGTLEKKATAGQFVSFSFTDY